VIAAFDALETILAAGAVVGGVAYALGQWVSARKRGASDALRIALEEVDAIKLRTDRLEKELHATQAELHEVRKENVTLRGLLVERQEYDEKFADRLEAMLAKQTRRLVDVLRERETKEA
jgi:hypothetical protein